MKILQILKKDTACSISRYIIYLAIQCFSDDVIYFHSEMFHQCYEAY